MPFAQDKEFVVLTHDLDFCDVAAATGNAKPSVVQVRASGVGVTRIGAQVIGGLALCAEELNAGALVTIDAHACAFAAAAIQAKAVARGACLNAYQRAPCAPRMRWR